MKILVIDDESVFREEVAEALRERGHECEEAGDGRSGIERAERFGPDVILCDLVMPGVGGGQVLEALRPRLPQTQFIMVTAHGTMESAIDAFRMGACDYLLKPVVFEELFAKIDRVERELTLLSEVQQLRRAVSGEQEPDELIGQSAAIEEVRRLIGEVASVDASVLLIGPTGSGKDVTARALHRQGTRHRGPFVAVNCSAIPDGLLESELFGHLRGAFTGADQDRPGRLRVAEGGTLFLDEITTMPVASQAKLLRAIEEREIVPVGGTKPVRVDFRLIAATNQDVGEAIADGRFREDLYFRVRVVEIHLPPLRERTEDIPLLVRHFVDELNHQMKRRVRGASNEALQALMQHPWPGNVRQLRNVIERAMIFRTEGFLEVGDLPGEVSAGAFKGAATDELKAAVKAFERHHILAVIDQCDGNRDEAARRLGIDRSTLYRRLAGFSATP